MAEPRKSRDGWLLVLYSLLLLAGMGLTAVGVYYAMHHYNPLLLAIGILAVIVPAALYPIAQALTSRPDTDPRVIETLQQINQRIMLSDTAKRIAFREQDRQALREAIRKDMEARDYEAALALVTEMGQTFGYRREAEDFRDQILAARKAESEGRISEGLAYLEQLLNQREWERALGQADKLARLYAESPRVKGLEKHVRDARDQHKRNLERQFLHAAERDDVEQAMELIKELDKYLSPGEAEPLREVARGVIGKKRQNLGVQFKLAVHDHEWSQAVRVGEQIIREFPNTRMADEVRGHLELLRERAAAERAASAAAPPVRPPV